MMGKLRRNSDDELENESKFLQSDATYVTVRSSFK